MKKLVVVLLLAMLSTAANAQVTSQLCYQVSGTPFVSCDPVTASNPLPIGVYSATGGVGTVLSSNGAGALATFRGPAVAATPSHTQACTAGQIWVDSSYLYVCVVSGTVERATLSTF